MEIKDTLQLIQLATTLLGPLVTAFAKWLFPDRLAKGAMPLLSAGATGGAALGLGADPATAALLGAASIGVRELVDRARKARRRPPVVGTLVALALLLGCAGDLPAAQCCGKNTACPAAMPCCGPDVVGMRLFKKNGVCKPCTGSTSDPAGCRASTTLPPVPTTTPTTRPPTTTAGQPSTTLTPTTSLPPATIPPGVYTQDDGPPTPARMPTGRDVSLRIPHDQQCRWWTDDGGQTLRTATQAERAAMFLMGTAVLTPQALLYAKYTPACTAAGRGKLGEYQTDNTRLRVFYVDALRDSEWAIAGGNGCDPYSHSEHLLQAIRACSTASASAKRACASSPYMTADLLDAADLRVVNGQCERGATFPLPPLPAREDPELKLRGHLLYRVPLPPLPAACRQQARCVGALHANGSRAKCGQGPLPLPAGCSGSVRDATVAMLACAPTEKWKHALLMLFPTATDPAWDAQERCDLGQVEHHAWMAWDSCLDLPAAQQWACLTRGRVNHETPHLLATYRHPTTLFRLGTLTDRIMDFPALTQDQLLDLLRAPGQGGIPWLPPDWRVLLN